MIKGLYEIFARNWYRGGSVWILGDPHFADKGAQSIRKNNISDTELIKNINSCLSKKDTLIILGDVGDKNFISQLKGYKVLIMGNHDKGADSYKRKIRPIYDESTVVTVNNLSDQLLYTNKGYIQIPGSYVLGEILMAKGTYEDNHLFDEVYEGPVFAGDRLILSHEPINLPYALNIHGHDHNKREHSSNCLNVCVEHIDYKPVCLSKILSSGIRKNIPTIHRITIDGAVERKKNKKQNK